MPLSVVDMMPLSQAGARVSELTDEARSGSEEIVTRNGGSHVALTGVGKRDCYRRPDRDCIHLLLLQDAANGLADVVARKVYPADEALAARRASRK